MASKGSAQVTFNPQTTFEGPRGIKADAAETALTAFEGYSTTITTAFTGFKEAITYDSAFFGEYKGSVETYVNAVMDSAQTLLLEINKFQEDLKTVVAQYQSQDTTMASDLDAAATGSEEQPTKTQVSGNVDMPF